MKTVNTHGTFSDALSGSSVEITEIANRLRDLIINMYPDVVEVPWPKQRIIGYGVGPKKMTEHFCYLGLHLNHVNLGFYYGAKLPDPQGLLEGTGKSMRHIKVRGMEELERQPIHDLLCSSLEERKEALGIG